jgi:hypothetical protein
MTNEAAAGRGDQPEPSADRAGQPEAAAGAAGQPAHRPVIDTSKPHQARVYDYWLGGKRANGGSLSDAISERQERPGDFSAVALVEALDAQRRARGLSWRQVAGEIRDQSAGVHARQGAAAHPLSPATLTGLRTRNEVGCQHALGMLRWLGQAPESFVLGSKTDPATARLPSAGPERRLRWDMPKLAAAVDAERRRQRLTWPEVASATGCSASQVAGLRRVRYGVSMRTAMRVVAWLGQPPTSSTRPPGSRPSTRSPDR